MPPDGTDNVLADTMQLPLCHLLQHALIKLLGEICHILPSAYRDECQDVIGKFSKTVLDAILSYATPQAICTLIQLCKGQQAPLVGQSASPSVLCAELHLQITYFIHPPV